MDCSCATWCGSPCYYLKLGDIKELPELAASIHMRHVILWTNGMCMVFDDRGEQMPYYQGRFDNRAQRINNVFRGEWEYGDWNRGILSGVPLELKA